MRGFTMKAVLGPCLIAILSGCGGSGNKAVIAPEPPTPVGTFGKVIPGVVENITGLMDVMSPPLPPQTYSHWQNLYLAKEIGSSGYLTGISFHYQGAMASAVTVPNLSIKVSHSNLENLGATFANNLGTGQGAQVTVRPTASFTFPAGAAGSWQKIAFATPFYYNGVDNLIAEFEVQGACTGRVLDACDQARGYQSVVFTYVNDPTGTTLDFLQLTKLHFAGGDHVPFLTSDMVNTAPFNTTGNNKMQMLYRADEMDGSGPIRGIGIRVGQETTAESFTVTMKVGHSSLSTLDTTFASNFNSGTPVMVADHVSFTVPAGIPADDYVWIPWTGTAFMYNGTDNLVIELDVSTATGSLGLRRSVGTAGVTRVLGSSGSLVGTVVDRVKYGVKLRFGGGNVDVITSGSGTVSMPFTDTSSTKSQHLYRAAELGSSGVITKIACRVHANSTLSTYDNFSVVLGHAANTMLSSTFSTNMTGGGTEVFRGTFTLPAGLKWGDWLEIPLTTPFTYDANKDLVIQLSSAPGNLHGVSMSDDNALRYYHGHAGSADSTTNTVTTLSNNITDVRLVLR
ncbi:MAG: hypothetical protein WAT51_07680 [Holophaga sp.]